jgi:3-hydroxy-3-methylglutaryl CoA synthase
MLVGPDAPLALDAAWHAVYSKALRRLRLRTYAPQQLLLLLTPSAARAVPAAPLPAPSAGDHTFDFYKPAGGSPYPEVDGPCSINTYMAALDDCAHQLRAKLRRAAQAAAPAASSTSGSCGSGAAEPVGLDTLQAGASAAEQQQPLQQPQQHGQVQHRQHEQQQDTPACSGALLLPQVDHFVAHAPFHRMVRKALARLLLGDALCGNRWVLQEREGLLERVQLRNEGCVTRTSEHHYAPCVLQAAGRTAAARAGPGSGRGFE